MPTTLSFLSLFFFFFLYVTYLCVFIYVWFWNLIKNFIMMWSESCSTVSDSLQPHGLYGPWTSPGQNTRVGGHSLLQGIFPTQGSNPCVPHCKWILYQLSHQRRPGILEWVAYPFSSGSFWPRNKLVSPALQADSLPAELPGWSLIENFRMRHI